MRLNRIFALLAVVTGCIERSAATSINDILLKSASFYAEPQFIQGSCLFSGLHGLARLNGALHIPRSSGFSCENQDSGERDLSEFSSGTLEALYPRRLQWAVPLSTQIQAALQSPERNLPALNSPFFATNALALQGPALRGRATNAAHTKCSPVDIAEPRDNPIELDLSAGSETTAGGSINGNDKREKPSAAKDDEEQDNDFVGMSPAFNTWRLYRKKLHTFSDVQQSPTRDHILPSTIETHIVSLPNEGSSSGDSSACRLTLSVQSALFNTVPLPALLVKEAFRTAAQLSVEAVPKALAPKVQVVFDERLPVLHANVEALECAACVEITLSMAERVKSWSVVKTIDAITSQREKEALTNDFFRNLGEAIRELQSRNTKPKSIIQDAFWYASYEPWIPPSLVLKALKPVKSGAIASPLQTMLDTLSEVLDASKVSLTAETNWDGPTTSSAEKHTIEDTARNIASIWAMKSLDSVETGVQLRAVKWPRSRDGEDVLVALKSGESSIDDSAVHMMGAFQVFEPKGSSGINTLGCSTRIALETVLLVAQQAVFPQFISHAAKAKVSLPSQLLNMDIGALVEESLIDEAGKLGIVSAEGRILGLESASPYVLFHFTSSEGGHTMEAFVNFLNKAISAVGKALKTVVEVNGQNELITKWAIPELKQKSDMLLGRARDTIAWNEVLRSFYRRHIRDRVYDFNQPWTCYEALQTLSTSQILNVWDRFLAEAGDETRRVWFVVGNAEDRWDKDSSPPSDGETVEEKMRPVPSGSSQVSASRTRQLSVLRSFTDIRQYKLSRALSIPYGVVESLALRIENGGVPRTKSALQEKVRADVSLPTLEPSEGAPR